MGAMNSTSPSPRLERFGSFVLLAETERSWLATDYRAAHLGDSGLDRLVQLVRFEPVAVPGAFDVLVEHVKAAAKAGNGVMRPLGTGRAGSGWLSYEHHGGRSLRAVLARAREEVFPLSLDNVLEVARQVCVTLEKVHTRKLSSGATQVHGYLAPWSVVVSYDGAVRLRGFGLWASGALGGLPAEEAGSIAPEQAEGHSDPRTDVYALGALMVETLRREPLPGGTDLRALLAETTGPEGDPLPDALTATLARALAPRPEGRHPGPAELRRELEALLFAGDVAPTTFNLAFFMETLFRGTVEEEGRAIEEETRADYLPYLRSAPVEKPAVPTPAEKPAEPVVPAPAVTTVPAPAVHADEPRIATSDLATRSAPAVEPSAPATPHAPLERPASPAAGRARAAAPNRLPVMAAGVVALLLAAGGAFYFLKVRRPAAAAPVPTTLSAEAQAAFLRVQELEARLKTLEEERVRAEAAAAEQATQRLQAEAKARGQAVDQRAIERAREEAALKVRLEEEKRQQEERQRLEQQKRQEEARLAAAAPVTTLPVPATIEPAPTTVATADTSAANPSAAPSAAVPSTPGVFDFGTPGVIPPVLVSQQHLEYPPVARTARITGSVTVAAIVNEQGRVEGARATSGNPVLRKAAVDHVNARRYRPALKDGVPIKIQMVIQVNFKG